MEFLSKYFAWKKVSKLEYFGKGFAFVFNSYTPKATHRNFLTSVGEYEVNRIYLLRRDSWKRLKRNIQNLFLQEKATINVW